MPIFTRRSMCTAAFTVAAMLAATVAPSTAAESNQAKSAVAAAFGVGKTQTSTSKKASNVSIGRMTPQRGAPERAALEKKAPLHRQTPQTASDFEIDGKGKLLRYKGTATEVRIPETVEVIGARAFEKSKVTKVTIPANVDTIEAMAFQRCADLTAVAFEVDASQYSRLYTIANSAFAHTPSLKEAILPASVRSLGASVFSGSGIERAAIPGYLQEIPSEAFSNTQKLKEVTLSEDLPSIGRNAFASSGLATVKVFGGYGQAAHEGLPSKLETIGDSAFSRTKLTHVKLPDAVESIGATAFGDNPQLKEIALGKGLKTIGREAFRGTGVTELVIPDSVVDLHTAAVNMDKLVKLHIGKGVGPNQLDEAFNGMASLETVSVADGNPNYTVVDGALLNASRTKFIVLPRGLAKFRNLRNYSVPAGVTEIGSGAFSDNETVEKIYLPNGLKRLGYRSFSNANALSDVRFPDSLEIVDGFDHTTALKEVDFGTHITTMVGAFDGKVPERTIVRGGKNGHFAASKDTHGTPQVAAYFGEGMTKIDYSSGRFPKVLVLPSSLKEFHIQSRLVDNEWKASAMFYVAADPDSSAWKLVAEKMTAFGMDPSKQLKKYTPLKATAKDKQTYSAGSFMLKAWITGGVDEGKRQIRTVTVSSDGRITPTSPWWDTSAVGDHFEGVMRYFRDEEKVQVRDHTGLTVVTEIENDRASSPSTKPTAEPTAEPTATPSPTASVSPAGNSETPSAGNAFVVGGREVFFGRAGDTPLMGDWDGDGISTPGVKRGNRYYLVNSIRGGKADVVFTYGLATDTPLVGDWDGNGSDTVSLRRGHTVYVNNVLKNGPAARVFMYGRDDDTPLVGDWNGDGKDTVSVRRGRVFYIMNRLAGGVAASQFSAGNGKESVVAGRWADGQKADTVGLVNDGTFQVLDEKGVVVTKMRVVRAPRYLAGVSDAKGPDSLVFHG